MQTILTPVQILTASQLTPLFAVVGGGALYLFNQPNLSVDADKWDAMLSSGAGLGNTSVVSIEC